MTSYAANDQNTHERVLPLRERLETYAFTREAGGL
jgi:hypothetical protein